MTSASNIPPRDDGEKKLALSDYEKDRRSNLSRIVVGGTDINGNKIYAVYATGDEHAIYSTDASNSIKSIHVRIATIDENDSKPIRNFQAVKGEYDRLRSLSNRTDDPSYATRVAHALALAIYGNPDQAKELLQSIAVEITKAYKERVFGKFSYLCGALSLALILMIAAVAAYLTRNWDFIRSNATMYEMVIVCAFAACGGIISVSMNIDTIVIDGGLGRGPYFYHGLVRSVISILGGLFIYFAIKSNLLMGFVSELKHPLYGICTFGILAGFSESFVPNSLKKLEEEANKKI